MNAKFLLMGTLVVALAGCKGSATKNSTQAKTTEAATEVATKANDFYGTYEGTLPCADCEGIKTTLTVNADSTYYLKSEYLGVKDGIFETNGVYNLLNNDLLELITPSSGEKTYYKILENSVMLSDEKGTINEGELAEYYVLKKN